MTIVSFYFDSTFILELKKPKNDLENIINKIVFGARNEFVSARLSLGGFAAVSTRLRAIYHRQSLRLRAIILARTHPLLLR